MPRIQSQPSKSDDMSDYDQASEASTDDSDSSPDSDHEPESIPVSDSTIINPLWKQLGFSNTDDILLLSKYSQNTDPTMVPFIQISTDSPLTKLSPGSKDLLAYVQQQLRLVPKLDLFNKWSKNPKKFFNKFESTLTFLNASKFLCWRRFIVQLVPDNVAQWIVAHFHQFSPYRKAKKKIIAKFFPTTIRYPEVDNLFTIKPLKNETVFDFARRYEDLFDDMNLAIPADISRDNWLDAHLFLAKLPKAVIDSLSIARLSMKGNFKNVSTAVTMVQSLPMSKNYHMEKKSKERSKDKSNVDKSANYFDRFKNVKCDNCNELGHYPSHCPKTKKDSSINKSSSNYSRINKFWEVVFWAFEGSSELIKIPIRINDKKILAILDTGCSVSCMSSDLASSLDVKLDDCTKFLILADQSKLNVPFTTNLTVLCGDLSFDCQPFVVDKLPVPFIFGMDLFNKFKMGFTNIPFDFPATISDKVKFSPKNSKPATQESYFVTDAAKSSFMNSVQCAIDRNVAKCSSGVCNLHEAVISLPFPDEEPKYIRQYPIAMRYRDIVTATVQEWLEANIISKAPTNCKYNNPLTTAPKKGLDGSIDPNIRRVCLNPSQINANIPDDKFTIPLIQEIFDKVRDCEIFSTIDLKSAFLKCPINPKDRPKTAFTWNFSQYMFNVAPFGIKTMSSKFQRLMTAVIQGMKFVVVFVDDLFIFSKNVEEHSIHVNKVLDRLTEVGLLINKAKCKFAMKSVHLLGHVVSKDGISIDGRKLVNIDDWSRPATDKQLQSFLGFINYFRAFIPLISKVAAPLEALRSFKIISDKEWTTDCQSAFCSLKELLLSAPVLSLPNPKLPYHIATDASYSGIGSVLYQLDNGVKKFIAFKARALRPSERNYSVNKLELLGLVYALKSYRQWIYGNKFTVYTDHQALVSLFSSKKPNPFLQRWMDILYQHNFNVVHINGSDNVIPDHLSRIFNQVITPPKDILNPIVNNDLFCFHSSISAPHDSILQELHSQGHFGSTALLKACKENNHSWPGIAKDCISIVKNCPICQKFNISKKGYHPLTPIHALLPFARISIDLAGPLPVTSQGSKYVLVIVDCASRFVLLRAIDDKSQNTIADSLFAIFCDFGFPKYVQSDRGTEFCNSIIHSLSEIAGFSMKNTLAYHQRANGLAERFVQTSLNLVRKFCNERYDMWDAYIPYIQWCMNLKIAPLTKSAPFSIMFGRSPRISPLLSPETLSDAKQLDKNSKFMIDIVFPAISLLSKNSQAIVKDKFDNSAPMVKFNVGDMVRYSVLDKDKLNKLSAPYSDIFKIASIPSPGSYKLVNKHGVALARTFAPSHLKLVPYSDFPIDTLTEIVSHGNALDGEDRYLVRDDQGNSQWETKDWLANFYPQLLIRYANEHMKDATDQVTSSGRVSKSTGNRYE